MYFEQNLRNYTPIPTRLIFIISMSSSVLKNKNNNNKTIFLCFIR